MHENVKIISFHDDFRISCILPVLYPTPTSVYADADTNSVTDCIKDPEACNGDTTDPAAKQEPTVTAAGDISAWEYIKWFWRLFLL